MQQTSSNPFSLHGRVALVTGCGSPNGIGFACARLLSDQGAIVAIASTTEERIKARADELRKLGHGKVLALVGDLGDALTAERIVGEVVAAFGRLDVLVNNAGMVQTGSNVMGGSLVSQPVPDFDSQLRITLMTAINTTRAALPQMRRNRYGRIVNVSSVTGPLVSAPGAVAYSVAKSGMDGLTRSVALEEAWYGININSVLPGWIVTDSSEDHELVAGGFTPVGRPGSAQEVAAAVAFLSSSAAAYITGTTLVVDGGNCVQEHHGPVAQFPISDPLPPSLEPPESFLGTAIVPKAL